MSAVLPLLWTSNFHYKNNRMVIMNKYDQIITMSILLYGVSFPARILTWYVSHTDRSFVMIRFSMYAQSNKHMLRHNHDSLSMNCFQYTILKQTNQVILKGLMQSHDHFGLLMQVFLFAKFMNESSNSGFTANHTILSLIMPNLSQSPDSWPVFADYPFWMFVDSCYASPNSSAFPCLNRILHFLARCWIRNHCQTNSHHYCYHPRLQPSYVGWLSLWASLNWEIWPVTLDHCWPFVQSA